VTDPLDTTGHGGAALVSVVIPTLEEEGDIAGCIAAVGAQDYPLGAIEVIVVDGCSTDATVAAAVAAAAPFAFAAFKTVDSPRRRTSISLNLGLAQAEGTYLVRVDARARIPADYVRRCVEVLRAEPTVGVVGGAQVPRARSGALADRGIARALDNRLATGLSRYRRSTRSGPADTVWMGSFRTAEVRALGGWSEDVALNEDWELNQRVRSSGAVVWFVGDLASGYLPRTSYRRLAQQYFAFGRVKGMWWVRGTRPETRQVALVAVPVAGVALVGALARRFGPAAALVVPAGYLAVERLGSGDGAGPAERGASAAAIAVFTAAWWVGVVAGVVGEVAGVEHRHRSAPV
jgi:succinoglycan biosynthesis protein ExoA